MRQMAGLGAAHACAAVQGKQGSAEMHAGERELGSALCLTEEFGFYLVNVRAKGIS